MSLDKAISAVRQAVNQCLALQKDDGTWCGEVHSNTTFTAQFVFLRHQLGLTFDTDEVEGLTHWILSQQNGDGSWSVGQGCAGDVSTTTETYLALKILGLSTNHPRMAAARTVIINLGGLPATRMFTRLFLASYGLIPWSALPALPTELILLPTAIPINVYHMSSWARATCLPLLLIRHHEPLYALPNGQGVTPHNDYLDELWNDSIKRDWSYGKPLRSLLGNGDIMGLLFAAGDRIISALGSHLRSPLAGAARRNVVEWILDHQEESGQWAGYWPPQHNNIWALTLEGYTLDHPVMRRALAGLQCFVRRDHQGMRVQVTVSGVWDTALMSIALADSTASTGGTVIGQQTVDWLYGKEVSSIRGDWRVLRPHLAPGGWCFEDFNTLYPDMDDSCAVVLGLLKTDPALLRTGAVRRTLRWIMGMQNRDGGWGAFDTENDWRFLNKMPFSDMDSMCDPSTPDVTGRVLECFGLILARPEGFSLDDDPGLASQMRSSCRRALRYVLDDQKPSGAWWGRWGVNYIYGTSNVLSGLQYFCEDGDDRLRSAVNRAIVWMQSVQNTDGGWGESPKSYSDAGQAGVGPSTAVQTAWGLIALLNYLPASDKSVERGVQWLVREQVPVDSDSTRGTWNIGAQFTATGFPDHLYLEYDYYRLYFPIMALGRYADKCRASAKETATRYYMSAFKG